MSQNRTGHVTEQDLSYHRTGLVMSQNRTYHVIEQDFVNTMEQFLTADLNNPDKNQTVNTG